MNAQLRYFWAILAIILLTPFVGTAQSNNINKLPKSVLDKARSISVAPSAAPETTSEACSTKNLLKGSKIKSKRGLRNGGRAVDGKAAGEGLSLIHI